MRAAEARASSAVPGACIPSVAMPAWAFAPSPRAARPTPSRRCTSGPPARPRRPPRSPAPAPPAAIRGARHEASRKRTTSAADQLPWPDPMVAAMRLVRIALASVEHHRRRRAGRTSTAPSPLGARGGRRRGHARGVPRAGRRRLPAGGPRAVARVRRRAAGRAPRASRARPRALGCASVARARRRARARTSTTSRRSCTPGASGASSRRRSSRSTTSSTRRARSRAARPGCSTTVDGVPFGDLVFELDFGDRRARGLRGRLVARRSDAPPLATRAPSSSSTCARRRSASASPRRGAR